MRVDLIIVVTLMIFSLKICETFVVIINFNFLLQKKLTSNISNTYG